MAYPRYLRNRMLNPDKPKLRLSPRVDIVRPKIKFDLRTIEDRRTYHPLGAKRPAAVLGPRSARRIVEKVQGIRRNARQAAPSEWMAASKEAFPALKLGFAVPAKVALCVRRKQRREAIFANKKTGAGAKAKRRRSFTSWMEC